MATIGRKLPRDSIAFGQRLAILCATFGLCCLISITVGAQGAPGNVLHKEFATVWYRPGDKGFSLQAYSASGKLMITETGLVFGEKNETLEIDAREIKSITWGKMPGDTYNEWAIVRYGEPEKVAGFKDGSRLGWGTDTKLIYSTLKTAFETSAPPLYQEFLMGGFDPKEWTVGHQTSDQDQRIIEFVRPGEKIDNWTELLTMQVLRKPTSPDPIDAFVARMHTADAKLCPNGFVQNVIAQGFRTETEEASIIYEWKMQNCRPHADQHEVAKIVYGKFSIFRLAYVAKTEKLAPEKREMWIKELKGAKIVVNKN
jgi:hypothetical protein